MRPGPAWTYLKMLTDPRTWRSALESGATLFVTNDKRLATVRELRVVVLEDHVAWRSQTGVSAVVVLHRLDFHQPPTRRNVGDGLAGGGDYCRFGLV